MLVLDCPRLGELNIRAHQMTEGMPSFSKDLLAISGQRAMRPVV